MLYIVFSECHEEEMSDLSRCSELTNELWNKTLQLVEDYV